MQRTNWAQAALGVGELILGAAADAGGTALMATGIGAPLGAALDVAGTGLAISGTATAIGAVAGPNIAYAVQDGDGGGGRGTPHESSDAGGSPSRDEQAQALAHEHGDGDGGPQLTLENAYKALDDAPEGTTLRKMPEEHEIKDQAGEKNPDIEILDRQGSVVGYREVKSQATGGAKRFGRNLSDAVNPLRNRGGKILQIFYQVPKESDVYRWIARWKGNRTGVSDLNRFTVHVVDDAGEDLGTYNLGRQFRRRRRLRRRRDEAGDAEQGESDGTRGLLMSDVASLICWDCSLVLNLGWFTHSAVPRRIVTESGNAASDPVATAAVWKFLAEHVYHRVELAGEQSPPWDHIDEDFTEIDGDLADSPSLAEYVEDIWEGRHLLLRPRPVCAAVRALLAPLEEARESRRWTGHPAEETAVGELLPLTRWPLPAERRVDDAEVLARAAAVGRARAAFDRVAMSFPDHQASLPAALRAFSDALAPTTDIPPKDLLKDRDDLMPAALFDAERALGLIGKVLDDIALDFSESG